MPNNSSHYISMKIEEITNRKKVCQTTTGAAESRTELAFMMFLCVAIERLPHRISDALLKTTPIESIKSKKVWNLFTKPTQLDQWASWSSDDSMFFCFALFGSDISFDFPFICTADTKYCNHGNDQLLLCDIGALTLIIF